MVARRKRRKRSFLGSLFHEVIAWVIYRAILAVVFIAVAAFIYYRMLR